MEPFLDFSSNPLICRTHCRLAAEIRRTAPSSTTGLLLLHLSAEMVASKQHMFWDQAIALHAASQHSIRRKLLLVRKGKDKRESVLRSYYAGPLTDDAWQLVRVYSDVKGIVRTQHDAEQWRLSRLHPHPQAHTIIELKALQTPKLLEMLCFRGCLHCCTRWFLDRATNKQGRVNATAAKLFRQLP